MKIAKNLVLFLIVLTMVVTFASCKKKADVPEKVDSIENSEYPLENDGKDDGNDSAVAE